ncbi:MAG TPA: tRNA (N(6)-L-threonylcarbamoyladenosine(37)-C(2))-methylthiotransferase MtaB [Candidatus Cloacimonadota bacterium]|nr:tRNA (N(6)-L-threonylcarbamoyladenosine(37)-C(2))-methylthiotransferase MtaB [Candidatus Cloacimonadota bacterium]
MKKRIAIATLGCKTNTFESACIAAAFGDEFSCVPFDQKADVYVVNTCTVTGRTDFKSRNLIRKAIQRREANPNVKVAITGCFAQLNPDEVKALGEVDLIVDNQHKYLIPQYLAGLSHHFAPASQAETFTKPDPAVDQMPENSRAFQKIQDGCGLFCAYCAISHARGPSRSAKIQDVIEQAKRFVQNGYQEIVLVGVNLALYRDGEEDLAELVAKLKQIEGLDILRLSSLEPFYITDKLVDELADSSVVAPHFHFPLQSGSDAILKSMGRPYQAADFGSLIHKVLAKVPDAAIGLDVIVGFPGETEDDFQATYALIDSLPLAYLHVFPFSKRPHTKAFDLPNQIPKSIKRTRVSELLHLSQIKTKAYIQKLMDEQITLRGVVEVSSAEGSEVLSDHYVRVMTTEQFPLGTLIKLKPTNIQQYKILCDVI